MGVDQGRDLIEARQCPEPPEQKGFLRTCSANASESSPYHMQLSTCRFAASSR